jgi:hypothetical protein
MAFLNPFASTTFTLELFGKSAAYANAGESANMSSELGSTIGIRYSFVERETELNGRRKGIGWLWE